MRTLACACAVLGVLAGCAPLTYTKAEIDGMTVCNVDAMAEVERKAPRPFTEIRWMNCPRATLRTL